jgi:hypothetical protein
MDIEEGFSPVERAATMSIACETVRLSAPQNALVETGLYTPLAADSCAKTTRINHCSYNISEALFAAPSFKNNKFLYIIA